MSVRSVADGPLLLTLWASWCAPCLVELEDFSRHWEQIDAAGADILALNIELLDDARSNVQKAGDIVTQLKPRFQTGIATRELVEQLDALRHRLLYRQDPLPLPVSFLLDGQGRLRVIYGGRVEVDQLLDDLASLSTDAVTARERAVPFPGRRSNELFVTNPIAIASIYRDERQYDDAIDYLKRYLERNPPPTQDDTSGEARRRRRQLADVHHLLGRVAIDQRQPREALKWLRSALEYHPGHFDALVDSADVLMRGGQNQLAADLLSRAIQIFSGDPDAHNKLGLALLSLKQVDQAVSHFETALRLDSTWFPAANNLAWLLATHPDDERRDGARAVELAERIARSAKGRPDVLDTLAAAYAEAGDYDRAVKAARSAAQQATHLNDLKLAQRIELRLQLYKTGQPYRDSQR